MQITKRDVEILKFINECGYCITPHLERKFGIKNWRVYQLMKRLVKAGFVRQVRIFHGKPNIYYLTREGAKFTDLPAMERVNTSVYEHHIKLIDVALRLRELYPLAGWRSERHLIHDKFFAGLGVKGHIADGLLVRGEDNQIAIEVELTVKNKQRLERIFRSYLKQWLITEVWYFCSPEVISVLKGMTEKNPIIKVHSLEELLR